MGKLYDLTGRFFGDLHVIKRIENYYGKSDDRTQWLCECACGKKIKVVGRYLKRKTRRGCYECHPNNENIEGKSKQYWGPNSGLMGK